MDAARLLSQTAARILNELKELKQKDDKSYTKVPNALARFNVGGGSGNAFENRFGGSRVRRSSAPVMRANSSLF